MVGADGWVRRVLIVALAAFAILAFQGCSTCEPEIIIREVPVETWSPPDFKELDPEPETKSRAAAAEASDRDFITALVDDLLAWVAYARGTAHEYNSIREAAARPPPDDPQ